MEDIDNTFPLWERDHDIRARISLDTHFRIWVDLVGERISVLFYNTQQELEEGHGFVGQLDFDEGMDLQRKLCDALMELIEGRDQITEWR